MKSEKPSLGTLGTAFFSWTQLYNQDLVKTGEIAKVLRLTPKQEHELLSRLARKGLIVRLIKGLYLVPRKLPPGGKWVPHEFTLVSKLMESLKANYQIGGPTVFNAYGLDDQVPNTTFVYNDKISGKRKIGSQSFYFVKVPAHRIGGAKENRLPDGSTVKIATLPRTLLDAAYDWSRFNTLPKAYDWIRLQKNNPQTIKELVDCTLQFGNIGTCKRLGYLLESLKVALSLVHKLKRSIPKSKALISWIPGRPMKGKVNRDWGLVINA